MNEANKVNKVKHTPGPWFFNGEDSIRNDLSINGFEIAQVRCFENWQGVEDNPINEDECAANAQLIAAAPELLEELETWRRYLRYTLRDIEGKSASTKHYNREVVQGNYDRVNKLINRAKGEN